MIRFLRIFRGRKRVSTEFPLPRICVVGLGNPGTHYSETKHNIGFQVTDLLAERLAVSEYLNYSTFMFANAKRGEWSVLLCKPMTYMNRSGTAVLDLHRKLGIGFSELLVVSDDVSLPLGVLRLRRHGGSGGHNGLSSILDAAEGKEIARLRCGIGFLPSLSDLTDYVLSPFDAEKISTAESVIEMAADVVFAVLDHGWDKAMNMYNSIHLYNQDSV